MMMNDWVCLFVNYGDVLWCVVELLFWIFEDLSVGMVVVDCDVCVVWMNECYVVCFGFVDL